MGKFINILNKHKLFLNYLIFLIFILNRIYNSKSINIHQIILLLLLNLNNLFIQSNIILYYFSYLH